MNKKMGERLGVAMGDVLVVDVDASGMAWGSFLRVKVLVEITKSLLGVDLSIWGGNVFGSCLSMNNYHYSVSIVGGLIKHPGPTCPNSPQEGRLREGSRAQYGSWLRASPQLRSSHSYSKKRDNSEISRDWLQNKQESSKYEESGMGSGAKGTSAATSNQVD